MSAEIGHQREFNVTNRLVLSIAVPMTLAYLTTPILGVVDTAVVGQFGNAAMIGGLATGAVVLDVIYTSFNFLRAGTTGLVAQAFGAGDESEQQAIFWRACLISAGSGLLMILLAPLIIALGSWFMDAGAAVAEAMSVYIGIRILGAPLTLINYSVLGYVLGRGEGTLGFGLQLLLNGINVVLSIYFGLVLGWGIAGVAWATVAAEAVAVVFGLGLVVLRYRKALVHGRVNIADRTGWLRMITINGDIMIRSFVLLAAFALFTRSGAQLGVTQLAANAVLMNFFLVAGYVLDGFATAAEQLSGRALGARYQPALSKVVRLTAIWGFALAVLIALGLLIFGQGLVALMTTAEDVRAMASIYLPWAAFTALTGVAAFQMDGIYIGATWSREMRNMMILSFAVFVVALPLAVGAWGNHGNWLALHLFLVVRGASLYALYPALAARSFAFTEQKR